VLKALIFDMDGVLVDSMPFHAAAWKKAFLDMGMEIQDEDIYAIEGSNPRNGLPLLIRKARKDPEAFDFETITAIYRQEFNRIFKLRAFDGMKECLELLKSRYLLSVVSGSDRFIVNGIVDQLFPGIFDMVVTGDDVLNSKPDPDPFLKAVELLNISNKECVVIENAVLGVEAAKRADIYCIGVPTYVEPSELHRADIVVGNHQKLMEHLLSLEPFYSPDSQVQAMKNSVKALDSN
jgi:HAD superfamily hydrolase (TIGR01509 family)